MARILVVDDSPTVFTLMRRMLEPEGHTCIKAVRTAEARTILAAEPPDAILCDINLPEENGVMFCHALKSDERYRRIPFVLVSAHMEMATFLRNSSTSADAYIAKPFKPDELIGTLARLLAERGGDGPAAA